MRPTAVVINMFYTGLGIARSLGENGIPVIGLTAQKGIYGNFTRYAKIEFAPDSRNEPEALLAYLLELGTRLGHRAVIFPTRDDDVMFLDRYRAQLSPLFHLAVPADDVVEACLNKWETFQWAERAGVQTPRCWLIENPEDLPRVIPEVTYPVVLKPLAAHHWRQGTNWEIVGGRKAISIATPEELRREYDSIAQADPRALLQELIPGDDQQLIIAAVYMDLESNFVAGFNTQKLVQVPAGFGTGCIVQAAHRPELFEPTIRLLQKMRFTGIAEVEYKWDAAKNVFQLIEVNPRPWDQHRLGTGCGTDLVYLAYCERAGLGIPPVTPRPSALKWIAEDTFATTALRLLRWRDPALRSLFQLAKGERIYSIWSGKDPLPSIAYLFLRFLPTLMKDVSRALWAAVKGGRGDFRQKDKVVL